MDIQSLVMSCNVLSFPPGVWVEEILNEPSHEKTNTLGFWSGPAQTELYKHRRWLEAGNFGFRKYSNCIIRVAKTKALMSFGVTSKPICAFVFAYADYWFSYAAVQF